jgi:hypothetical protein
MLTLLESEIQDGHQLQKRILENDIKFILVGMKHTLYINWYCLQHDQPIKILSLLIKSQFQCQI